MIVSKNKVLISMARKFEFSLIKRFTHGKKLNPIVTAVATHSANNSRGVALNSRLVTQASDNQKERVVDAFKSCYGSIITKEDLEKAYANKSAHAEFHVEMQKQIDFSFTKIGPNTHFDTRYISPEMKAVWNHFSYYNNGRFNVNVLTQNNRLIATATDCGIFNKEFVHISNCNFRGDFRDQYLGKPRDDLTQYLYELTVDQKNYSAHFKSVIMQNGIVVHSLVNSFLGSYYGIEHIRHDNATTAGPDYNLLVPNINNKSNTSIDDLLKEQPRTANWYQRYNQIMKVCVSQQNYNSDHKSRISISNSQDLLSLQAKVDIIIAMMSYKDKMAYNQGSYITRVEILRKYSDTDFQKNLKPSLVKQFDKKLGGGDRGGNRGGNRGNNNGNNSEGNSGGDSGSSDI